MLALKVTTLLKISRTIVRQEQPVDAVASGQKQVQQRRLQLTDVDSAGDAEFLANDIRVKKGLDGLGCLGDMGWYCVRAALWAYGFEKPVSVSAHAGKHLSCVTTSLATLGPDLHCLLFSYSAVSQRRYQIACCSWIT